MTKYYSAWTPSKISDFVTPHAIRLEGGYVCKEHKRECDAILACLNLNRQTMSGYYCVMVADDDYKGEAK